MPVEKSAGAVVFHRSREGKIEYLLLQHNKTYWNFPKGRIDKNETEKFAARREISEETGIKKFRFVPGFKIYDKYFYRVPKDSRRIELRGRTLFKIVAFFLAQAQNKKVKISWEHLGYEWSPYKVAVKKLKKYRGSQKILKKANAFLNKISKKSISSS